MPEGGADGAPAIVVCRVDCDRIAARGKKEAQGVSLIVPLLNSAHPAGSFVQNSARDFHGSPSDVSSVPNFLL